MCFVTVSPTVKDLLTKLCIPLSHELFFHGTDTVSLTFEDKAVFKNTMPCLANSPFSNAKEEFCKNECLGQGLEALKESLILDNAF